MKFGALKCVVLVSYGGMSEKGIYLLSRSACQQADAYGIRRRGGLCCSFRMCGGGGGARQAGQ